MALPKYWVFFAVLIPLVYNREQYMPYQHLPYYDYPPQRVLYKYLYPVPESYEDNEFDVNAMEDDIGFDYEATQALERLLKEMKKDNKKPERKSLGSSLTLDGMKTRKMLDYDIADESSNKKKQDV